MKSTGSREGEANLENNVVHVTSTISKGVGNKWFVKDGTKISMLMADAETIMTLVNEVGEPVQDIP